MLNSGVRFADVDLRENDDGDGVEMDDRDEEDDDDSEEEEEEGDDSEFIDLLDVLDGKGEIDIISDSENPSNRSPENSSLKIDDEDEEDAELSQQDTSSDSDSTSEEGEEEEALDFDPSDDDEEMPDALDDLNDFISSLDFTSTKRKATEDPSEIGDTRARKRRLVKERTEAGAENEFRARSSGIFFFIYFVIILHF